MTTQGKSKISETRRAWWAQLRADPTRYALYVYKISQSTREGMAGIDLKTWCVKVGQSTEGHAGSNKPVTIYLIRCLTNGKIYIGQTVKSLQKRWGDHLQKARAGRRYAICNAIRKYGESSFRIQTLAVVEAALANETEIGAIAAYHSNDPVVGYNLAVGGNRSPQSPETRRRISEAKKGKSLNLSTEQRLLMSKRMLGNTLGAGRKHSDEEKQKISAGNRGKIVSEQTCEKLRLACVGRKPTPECLNASAVVRRGKPMPEFHRLRISEALRARFQGLRLNRESNGNGL